MRFPWVCFFTIGLIPTLVSFAANASEASEAMDALPSWGIVKICSKYQDEGRGGAHAEFCGTGAVVVVPNLMGEIEHTFVLTASHVAQGEGLRIVGPDAEGAPKTLELPQIKGRLARNRRDVEILEIPGGSVAPSAIWDSFSRRVVFGHRAIERWRDSQSIVGEENPTFGANGAFALKTPWSSPGSIESTDSLEATSFSGLGDPGLGRLEVLPVTGEFVGTGKISNGMSGSPLVQRSTDNKGRGQWILRGISSRLSRDFTGSWFVSDREVANLIEAYLAGDRGTDRARWKMWKGITYRDFGNGVVELNPLRETAGGQTSGDGGSGGKVDPRRALAPGILFHGESAIGLRVLRGTPVYAEQEVADLLDQPWARTGKVTAIRDGDNLRDLLIEKLKRSELFRGLNSEAVVSEVQSGKPFRLKTFMLNEGLGISPSSTGAPEISFESNGKIRFELSGPSPQKEKINFTLDPQGHLLDHGTPRKHFSPVITVRGELGNEYVVDLRRLFFVDLSTMTEPAEARWFTLDRDRKSDDGEMALARASREGPVLVMRPRDSSQSYVLPFISAREQAESLSPCHTEEDRAVTSFIGELLPLLND